MELELWFVIVVMVPMKSGSESRGSGDGENRRRSRQPSGLHRHWPAIGVEEGSNMGDVAAELPIGLALTLDRKGCGSGFWRQ